MGSRGGGRLGAGSAESECARACVAWADHCHACDAGPGAEHWKAMREAVRTHR